MIIFLKRIKQQKQETLKSITQSPRSNDYFPQENKTAKTGNIKINHTESQIHSTDCTIHMIEPSSQKVCIPKEDSEKPGFQTGLISPKENFGPDTAGSVGKDE